MTPGARAAAAIDILEASATDHRPIERLVQAYFRRRRYAGARDRRAVAADVFQIVRSQAKLDWWIRRAGCEPGARARWAALLAITAALKGEALVRLMTDGPHAPGKPDDALVALADAAAGNPLEHPAMAEWTRHEYPAWLEPSLRRAFGADLAAEADALNQPAPMDIRVNALKTEREVAIRALAAEGIEARPTAFSPWGLRCPARVALDTTRTYRNGFVEVQDEGSQIAALLADATPGLTVVDYCAGAGGKTLALAAAMQGQGRLVALDTDPLRLHRLTERLRRAGANWVEDQVILDRPVAAAPLPVGPGEADRVLVDAPCSGTGTWRRDPLLRWRLTPDVLAGHVLRQRRIVDRAADLVRPGGRLIYVTCSLLPEENEDVIADLLARRPEFSARPARAAWTLDGPPLVASEDVVIRLSPRRTATDGYSIAVLERAPA